MPVNSNLIPRSSQFKYPNIKKHWMGRLVAFKNKVQIREHDVLVQANGTGRLFIFFRFRKKL